MRPFTILKTNNKDAIGTYTISYRISFPSFTANNPLSGLKGDYGVDYPATAPQAGVGFYVEIADIILDCESRD